MRLLFRDARRHLAFLEAPDSRPPPFAILSHTWSTNDQDEVSYSDIAGSSGSVSFKSKQGYKKIEFCLNQAADDDIKYVWVDTCCINKYNAVEVGKAINWMYRWYAAAERCYVYLADVTKHKRQRRENGEDSEASTSWHSAFCQSRWFTRGWTLQELLAPTMLEFFTRDGTPLGTRAELEDMIHDITGIPVEALKGKNLAHFSIQERYSWASKRITKEPEDIIYCLLGLLGVTMEPIYGELKIGALRRLRKALTDVYSESLLQLDSEQEAQQQQRAQPVDEVATPLSVSTSRSNNEGKPEVSIEWFRQMRQLLRYDQKDLRRSNIQEHVATPYRWLLEHPKYQNWRADEPDADLSNILWIRGNAGAGKSTLIKTLDTQAWTAKQPQDIVISFYFHAGGDAIEKSVEGLYRSLLCQLIDQAGVENIAGLAVTLKRCNIPRPGAAWPLITLQTMFSCILSNLHPRRLTIFIDALDECQDQEIRDTLRFVEMLPSDRHRIMVCLASRYYPVYDSEAVEIKLEEEPGHNNDIAQYVDKTLRVGRDARAREVKSRLLSRAQGVFMFAILLTRLVNTDYETGELLNMQARLNTLPNEMTEIFRDIITRDNDRMSQLVLCLQWVLFAPEPMSPREFHLAMMIDSGRHTWEELRSAEKPRPEDIRRYVVGCSKGLVEVVWTPPRAFVRFVYDPIRDFLLGHGGLSRLWPHQADVHCSSHERLKGICKAFLDASLQGWHRDTSRVDPTDIYRRKFVNDMPFIEYAASTLIHHTEQAAHCISQDDFASQLDLNFWRQLDHMTRSDSFELIEESDGLLHFFVRHEAVNLICGCLKHEPSLINSTNDQNGSTPLHLACQSDSSIRIVRLLLNHGADVDIQDAAGNTALILATTFDASMEVIDLLLSHNADIAIKNMDDETAVYAAMEYDRMDVLAKLIERENASPGQKEFRETAIHQAVRYNNVDVLRFVLARSKLSVNDLTTKGLSALHLAVDDQAGVARSLVPVLLAH